MACDKDAHAHEHENKYCLASMRGAAKVRFLYSLLQWEIVRSTLLFPEGGAFPVHFKKQSGNCPVLIGRRQDRLIIKGKLRMTQFK